MASAPAANWLSKTAWKSPALAAAVLGNGASGAVMRCQNSSVVRSTPALNRSLPKVTSRGTTVMPPAAAAAAVRSDAESVTMATRLMAATSWA